MNRILYASLALLLLAACLYGITIIKQQGDTIQKHEKLISNMQKELEYQNNVDYILRNYYADVQAQIDWDELYMWQYSTDRLSRTEFGAKVEDNPRRSKNLLEIKKHSMPWEK